MLKKNTVALFSALLSEHQTEENSLFSLLSPDEIIRAERFHSSLHRQRFVITRGLLRKQLGAYTHTAPRAIEFSYQPNGKPYLSDNAINLHFNVSHSDAMALFAFMLDHEIGVDIEKMHAHYNPNVAKRFFSTEEYQALMMLPISEQPLAFYSIWSAKEAVIKAAGAGLFSPISDFSVSLSEKKQTVFLKDDQYHIHSISVHPHYAAAIAVKKLTDPFEVHQSKWVPSR